MSFHPCNLRHLGDVLMVCAFNLFNLKKIVEKPTHNLNVLGDLRA